MDARAGRGRVDGETLRKGRWKTWSRQPQGSGGEGKRAGDFEDRVRG